MCDNAFTEIGKNAKNIKRRLSPLKRLSFKELFGKKTHFSLLLAPTKLEGAMER